MSNIAYPKGKMCPYSHITARLSFLHNHYLVHFHNSHFKDCFQQPDFPLFQRDRAFKCIQTYFIIDIVYNAHFWTFTWIINLCQPWSELILQNGYSNYLNLLINRIYKNHSSIHFTNATFVHLTSPSILLSLIVKTQSSSSIALFLWDNPYPFESNFHLLLFPGLYEPE